VTPPTIDVVRVDRLELAFAPRPWPFASERRAEIDAYFADLRRQKPPLWNGQVLLMHEHALADDELRGAFFATDYASFLAWRDWDFPDRSIRNCFAMAALRSGDGAFLLGVMNAHTANAGRIYFPGGTPDPDDIVDGKVDLDGSIARELEEETGLAAGEFVADSFWHAAMGGARIALLKILHAREGAAALRERVLAHLARQRQPELADIRIVRGPTDFDRQMPSFVTAFLASCWR
jgi:8-oxo-dGTP pyrophosphatase MutT (NUDIX family)